jgi:hypothetical protein
VGRLLGAAHPQLAPLTNRLRPGTNHYDTIELGRKTDDRGPSVVLTLPAPARATDHTPITISTTCGVDAATVVIPLLSH